MMETFLRLEEVLKHVGIGKTALYGHIKNNKFPRPVKIGKASRWPQTELA